MAAKKPSVDFCDIGLILYSWLLLARVALALNTQPFARYRAWLGEKVVSPPDTVADPSDAEMQRAIKIGQNVDRAARLIFWESECLPRAMVTAYMLRREAIDYTATIGARLIAGAPQPMHAHAWVDVGDRTVSGSSDDVDHMPLVHFRPKSRS